ncbi:MAG: helix-turn-helix domain-containing protein [Candidatus Nanopelagicales bacterium]
MQTMQKGSSSMQRLLSARQVQDILHIDRSTVYRMAEDGRLPAIRVGKQWRFPADEIYRLVSSQPPVLNTSPMDPHVAAASADVAAELLGVMVVVTDMEGHPITPIANPCPWMVAHADDPEVLQTCIAEWHRMADDHSFEPHFSEGQHGFECARAFVRSGRELVGMVLAGGVKPQDAHRTDLYDLDPDDRRRVLEALPKVAAALSRTASAPGAPKEEK